VLLSAHESVAGRKGLPFPSHIGARRRILSRSGKVFELSVAVFQFLFISGAESVVIRHIRLPGLGLGEKGF